MEEGEDEEDDGGDDGDARPGIAEVAVVEGGAAAVELVVAVCGHLLDGLFQVAPAGVDDHFLAQAIEQPRHLLVAPQAAHQHALPSQQRHVGTAVDHRVHEPGVGRQVVADCRVALLERDQVPE